MIIADLLGWWYSRGWVWIMRQFFTVYVGNILKFFSVTELLQTLFAPFRQDVIETKGAPLSVKLQVLGGNIISRFFGFIIRTTLIFTGIITLFFCVLVGGLVTLSWPLLPASPLLAVIISGMVF